MQAGLLGWPVSSLCICASVQENASEEALAALTEQMSILTEKEPYRANLVPFLLRIVACSRIRFCSISLNMSFIVNKTCHIQHFVYYSEQIQAKMFRKPYMANSEAFRASSRASMNPSRQTIWIVEQVSWFWICYGEWMLISNQ